MALSTTDKTYRDGGASSTALLDDAMHESGAAEHGERLDWHHDPATLDEVRRQVRDEPQEVARKAAEWTADKVVKHALFAAVAKVGGNTMARAGELLVNPLSVATKPIAHYAMQTVKTVAGAAGVAETATIGAGVATVVAAVRNVQLAEKLRAASDVVAMDLAATSLLDLDQGYTASVYRRYDGSIAPDSLIARFKNADGSLTAYGRENLPKLHAACDAGRSAALQAVYCDDPKGFLDANPKIKERVAHDLAFSKGWDEVMYVKDQPGAAAKLEAIEHGVKARDGWSGAQAIPVRA